MRQKTWLRLLQGNNKGPQFTQVFTLAFFGSVAVTLNIKLLGGKMYPFHIYCSKLGPKI
jgi:hypothetical protein